MCVMKVYVLCTCVMKVYVLCTCVMKVYVLYTYVCLCVWRDRVCVCVSAWAVTTASYMKFTNWFAPPPCDTTVHMCGP